ncbi:MAG: hypothetical protein M3Q19_12755 [Pseudomonadota bacterium]|nr:hypothetical protein [Pseudomonadota bacterium]
MTLPDNSDAAGLKPLAAATELIRRLNEAQIGYGAFGDSQRIAQGLAGLSALNLIVASADMDRLRAALTGMKAIRGLILARKNAVAGPEHWFVPDFSCASYLHLEVTTEIRVKRQRQILRYEDIAWQVAPCPLPPLRVMPIDAALVVPASAVRRVSEFSPAFVSAGEGLRPGGLVVALIGPDGVGKSSQTARLASIFQQKFQCRSVYLGSGDGGWKLRRAIQRRYYLWRGRNGNATIGPKYMKVRGTRSAFLIALSGLMSAIERTATLHRVRKSASSGAIVISDRWPQNLQAGLFDGPRLVPADASLSARILSKISLRLHSTTARHKPALTIHLLCDFETSNARKPGDRDQQEYEWRLSLMDKMRAHDPAIRVIDASRDFDEVTRSLFHCIWHALAAQEDAAVLQPIATSGLAAR